MACAKARIAFCVLMWSLKMLLLCVDGPLDAEPSTSDADDAVLMNKPANAKRNRMSYL